MTQSKTKTDSTLDSPAHEELMTQGPSPASSTYLGQLEDLEKKPRRPLSVHWGAFFAALVSFLLLVIWAAGSRTSVPIAWVWVDTGISAFFIYEFSTRSGFQWNPARYMLTHIFDFIAIIPALLLAYYGVVFEGIWVWIIVAGRLVRTVDRLLGDGFIRRNTLALLEGLEEEITDRVMLRIISRVQADMDRGSFARVIAEVLERNRSLVLGRIHTKHPQSGIPGALVHVTRLDNALERGELMAYNMVVDIMRSPEIDHAVRDAVNSIFATVQTEIGVKNWRKHLGLKR